MTISTDSDPAAEADAPAAPAGVAPDVGIRVENVSLCFRRYGDPSPSLKQTVMRRVLRRNYTRTTEHYIYRDLNVTIDPGERVGIVGHNGAGKTTLLKLIAGVYAPTRGRVAVRGSVATLIDIGAGLNPELSGVENIILTGLVLGRSLRRMRERTAHILDFAGLTEFAQMPVKYYSTGMTTRLAFSVATDDDPQILLADEIFSGGDLDFSQRAQEHMHNLIASAHILVFVSHGLDLIESLTTRCLWIDHGHILMDGPSAEVVDAYVHDRRPE